MTSPLLNDLELLAALFEHGDWKELHLKADGLEILLSNDPEAGLSITQVASVSAPAPQLVAASPAAAPAAAPAPRPSAVSQGAVDPNWHAVIAPNLGTFYRSPKPGSPPFVEIGQRVEASTEICLLEVMKLFTSVNAGVAGKIAQVCAADAELVEGGQVLYYIEKD